MSECNANIGALDAYKKRMSIHACVLKHAQSLWSNDLCILCDLFEFLRQCAKVHRSLSPPLPLEIEVEVFTLLNLVRAKGIGIMTAMR